MLSKPFDHLFEWSVFCGDSIVVGKSNNLSDLESKVLAEFSHEFHCGKRIGTIAVSDELKVLRKLGKPLKSHAHDFSGANATVVGYLITEFGRADSAEELPFGAIVFIEKWHGSIASGAGTVIRDVTFRAAADGSDFLAIPLFKVRDEVFVVPVLVEVGNQREFINLELLVLRRMGIIKSPLFERDISADKQN